MHYGRMALLVAIAVIIGGCAALKPFLMAPEVEFDRMEIQTASILEAGMVFYFSVKNPNPFGGEIQHLTYELSANDRNIANGSQDEGVFLPGKGSAEVALPVTVNFLDAIEAASDLFELRALPYRLSGKLRVMGIDVPYQKEGSFALPALPKISLKQLALKHLDWKSAAMDVILEVDNQNDFMLSLAAIDYHIQTGGRTLMDGRIKAVPPISGNGNVEIALPVNLDFFRIGPSIYSLLKQQAADYDISGQMIYNTLGKGNTAIPFHFSGQVPISQ